MNVLILFFLVFKEELFLLIVDSDIKIPINSNIFHPCLGEGVGCKRGWLELIFLLNFFYIFSDRFDVLKSKIYIKKIKNILF
jgi:hypothetical protein